MPLLPPSHRPWYRVRVISTFVLFAGWCFCLAQALEPRTAEAASPALSGGVEASMDDGSAPVPLPEAESPVNESPTILIDAGHGGTDPGTVANDAYEKTWTLPIAQALAEELRTRGWPVEMTRTEDIGIGLVERSVIANAKPRLLFVSVHLNSGQPDASGVEIYYSWPKVAEVMSRLHSMSGLPVEATLVDERGAQLAAAVQASLCKATGAKNRGVRNNPELAVTRRTLCPAILAEVGFLTNAAESRLFATPAYRQKVANGLADGIDKWLRENQGKGSGNAQPTPR